MLKFGSPEHRKLLSFSKTITTRHARSLREHGLITLHGSLTRKGKQVLQQLNIEGDTDGPTERQKLLILLQASYYTHNSSVLKVIPITSYLESKGLLRYEFKSGKGYQLTTRGKGWLQERAAEIIDTDVVYYLRKEVVKYLSLEALPRFLVHSDSVIREAAQQRYKELGGKE